MSWPLAHMKPVAIRRERHHPPSPAGFVLADVSPRGAAEHDSRPKRIAEDQVAYSESEFLEWFGPEKGKLKWENAIPEVLQNTSQSSETEWQRVPENPAPLAVSKTAPGQTAAEWGNWMPIETEGDRRLRKRNAVIKAIKEREEYRLYLHGDFAIDAVVEDFPEPVTPDPAASTSKRDWECQIMKWRTTLKVATGVIPLQALKNKQFRFVFGRDRPGTKTSSSSTAPTA